MSRRKMSPIIRTKAPWPKPGYRYGYLVVTSRGMDDRHGKQRFWCRCDCGKRRLVRADYLQNGRVSSCGRSDHKNLTVTEYKGYRCVETGEVFRYAQEAMHYAGIDQQSYRTFLEKSKTGQDTIGKHPETGEPLHWERNPVEVPYLPPRYRDKRSLKGIASRKIVLLNTGEVFPSLLEAARKTGVNNTGISKCCSGVRKSAGKDELGYPLIWMFYDDWIHEAEGTKK